MKGIARLSRVKRGNRMGKGRMGFGRLVAVCALIMLGSVSMLYAEQYISANDLDAGAITATVTIDGFGLFARSDKGITIEAINEPRTAEDGEIFNARIKLNGSGAIDYRSIHFTVKDKAKVTLYLNSSSKTDARVLVLAKADGTVVAELTAPPDAGTSAGIAKAEISSGGEYVVFSKNSGINIYQIVVE